MTYPGGGPVLPVKRIGHVCPNLNIGFGGSSTFPHSLGKADKVETSDSHIATAPAKSETWKRGLIMLVFMFAFGVGQSILYLTAVAQFLWLLFAKEPNKLLVEFGKSLAAWLAQTARFLCCATEEKPFPLGRRGRRLIEAEPVILASS